MTDDVIKKTAIHSMKSAALVQTISTIEINVDHERWIESRVLKPQRAHLIDFVTVKSMTTRIDDDA